MDTYTFSRNRGVWELKKAGEYKAIRSGENRDEIYPQVISYLRIHGGILRIHGYEGDLKEELTFTKRNAPPKDY